MNIPRVQLAHLPTRVEELPRISKHLGGPKIYVKRDDQTGLGFGGNKTRKLEYLLADAQQSGARTLLTVGAAQSNHCRQTAALAARFGFKCILVLSGEKPDVATGNLYLDQLFGARIVWTTRENRESKLQETYNDALENGDYPYLIPYGASNAFGMFGYVNAVGELKEQGPGVDWVIVATSSGGTQAGMILGTRLHQYPCEVLGISIDHPSSVMRGIILPLIDQGAGMCGEKIRVDEEDVMVNDEYLGEGYGILGSPEIEAIQLFAKQEGLLLDPVYTGRAAAGLIDLVRKGFFKKGDRVLFWHTGGTPALFAEPYRSLLQRS